MPPASASRSITTTSPTPRRRSSSAAASPAGPPPTIATSVTPGHQPGQLGAAVEALAAAHVGAGAPAQAVEVDGRQRTRERVAHLAARDALAEADDPPVLRVAGDPLGLPVGAREGLPDVGHAHGGQVGAR